MTAPDPIQPLRDALAATPDNVPLRRHLADTLAAHGRHGEAEAEYRELLRRAPDDAVRLALAECYLGAGKASHAAVVTEAITARDDAPAHAFVVLARVRMAERDLDGARSAFRKACDIDPGLATSDAAAELGLGRPASRGGPHPWAESLRDSQGFGDEDDDDDEDDIDVDVDEDEDDAPPPRVRAGRGGDDDGAGRLTDVDFERPKMNFSDVGGMDDVKAEISIKVIQPLAHPDLFKAYGKAIGGGVLMYGPPGCGKTHIARATAGEADAAFISVGIHEVLEMWIGSSERNLHRLFEEARRRAPCVLFFDEVDALGAKRSEAGSSASRQIINQFLAELDGVVTSNEGLLVLAATNAPWHLDPAFRRPGRFDRLVFVPPPDDAARAAILEVLLKGKPTDGVDVAKVAKKAKGFSGADLAGALDRAIEVKLREALETGRPAPITTGDLVAAVKGMRPTTKEWMATARNHVQFANQSGHYDDVARHLGLPESRGGDA